MRVLHCNILLVAAVWCAVIASLVPATQAEMRIMANLRWQNADNVTVTAQRQMDAVAAVLKYIQTELRVNATLSKMQHSLGMTPSGVMNTIASFVLHSQPQPQTREGDSTRSPSPPPKRGSETAHANNNAQQQQQRSIGIMTAAETIRVLARGTSKLATEIIASSSSTTAAAGEKIPSRQLLGYKGWQQTDPPKLDILLGEDIKVQSQYKAQPFRTVGQSHVTTTAAPWPLDRINQPRLPLDGDGSVPTDQTTGPSDAWIYIVDVGILSTHEQLYPRVTLVHDQYPSQPIGCEGHATHVASLAAGTTLGVNPLARLFDVRVLDCTGSGLLSDVTAGITAITSHCTTNGGTSARSVVVNMSLGGPGDPSSSGAQPMASALYDLYTQCDAVIVAAAGNSAGSTCLTLPAGYVDPSQGRVIPIGASDISDGFASFSNFGPCNAMNSPGVAITGAWVDSDTSYAVLSGTSMAAPIVAGVASLHAMKRPPGYNVASNRVEGYTLFSDYIYTKMLTDASPVISGAPANTTPRLVQITSVSINATTPITPVAPIAFSAAGERFGDCCIVFGLVCALFLTGLIAALG